MALQLQDYRYGTYMNPETFLNTANSPYTKQKSHDFCPKLADKIGKK